MAEIITLGLKLQMQIHKFNKPKKLTFDDILSGEVSFEELRKAFEKLDKEIKSNSRKYTNNWRRMHRLPMRRRIRRG